MLYYAAIVTAQEIPTGTELTYNYGAPAARARARAQAPCCVQLQQYAGLGGCRRGARATIPYAPRGLSNRRPPSVVPPRQAMRTRALLRPTATRCSAIAARPAAKASCWPRRVQRAAATSCVLAAARRALGHPKCREQTCFKTARPHNCAEVFRQALPTFCPLLPNACQPPCYYLLNQPVECNK